VSIAHHMLVHFPVEWMQQGEQVVSVLAEPFVVGGEIRPTGTGVRIDLPTGNVSASGR